MRAGRRSAPGAVAGTASSRRAEGGGINASRIVCVAHREIAMAVRKKNAMRTNAVACGKRRDERRGREGANPLPAEQPAEVDCGLPAPRGQGKGLSLGGSGNTHQRAEGRGQRAEGRRQRAEGRGQKAEGRGQRAEVSIATCPSSSSLRSGRSAKTARWCSACCDRNGDRRLLACTCHLGGWGRVERGAPAQIATDNRSRPWALHHHKQRHQSQSGRGSARKGSVSRAPLSLTAHFAHSFR